MSRVIITAPAKQDLKDISNYVAHHAPDAAKRLKERIKEQCQVLANFPEIGRRWNDLMPPLRCFPVGSYLIFYHPIQDGIEVVRVISGYRDLDAIFPRQNDG